MTKPKRQQDLYRLRFVGTHGLGPFPCHFCRAPVPIECLVVHHVDEDYANNAVENLAAAHRECHDRHHANGRGDPFAAARAVRWAKPGARAAHADVMQRVNAAMTHEQRSASALKMWETRDREAFSAAARAGQAKRGPRVPHTDEAKAKMSANHRHAVAPKDSFCPECGKGPTTAAAIGAHRRYKHST